jgi:serine/threonine protein phosphatase PrpC
VPALPADNLRIVSLAFAALLLVLLIIVLILLVRAIRQKQAPAPAAPAPPSAEEDPDLTRLRAFSADLLPRLAFDEAEDGDEVVTEDSMPVLKYEGDAEVGADEPTGAHDLIAVAAAGQTDRGMKRKKNEDAFHVDQALDLYVVADGMGGYAGGDVASTTAVKEVRSVIERAKPVKTEPNYPRRGRELVVAIERANEVIFDTGRKRQELTGMGTTILSARFSRRRQRMYVAYVGDSRLYRLRNGSLDLLTTDHTLAAKGVTGPLSSNIRRAVGVSASVKVDVLVEKPLPNDCYLLCSDGMHKMLSEEQIVRILSEQREDLSRAVAALVSASNAAGGKDNITVIAIGIEKAGAKGGSKAQAAEARN